MNQEAAKLLAEHGLLGVAAQYVRELRGASRPSTVKEVQGSLRGFLRWVAAHQRLAPAARIDPGVLSVSLLHAWWDWMLSPDRVTRVRVRRGERTYVREYTGALRRSSAYKAWTSIVAFWRWAADADEFEGAVPRCPKERLWKPYVDEECARRQVVAASWTEAASCVAAVPEWVRPLAILCYYTGLRVDEARSLTWDDVHLTGRFAEFFGGPVLHIRHGKTRDERRGRFAPMHEDLARWLRERRAAPPGLDSLTGDLRRESTKAYAARVRGLEEGRIAWEVGEQNLSLQLSQAWKAAGVPPEVWAGRTAHAFRKALRTNVMEASTEPGSKAYQAAERLIGHRLGGQVDVYQADRALMPTMRALLKTVPRWQDAARRPGQVIPLPSLVAPEDLAALG